MARSWTAMPYGLRVEPEPARDLLAARPGQPLPEHRSTSVISR